MQPMITVSDFCQKEYGSKLYKISFSAGMGCPNRDGTKGYGGCIFCSEGGSGDYAVDIAKHCHWRREGSDAGDLSSEEFEQQIEEAKQKVAAKYKGDKYIAYFQAYTNTYAPAEQLRKLYMPIIKRDDIRVLSIATRPDCIDEETYELLDELNRIKPVWVELGLQTVKEESIGYIRRGYDTRLYDEAVRRLNKLGIHTITHVILFLPGESICDMKNTVKHAVEVGTKGIKLQLLHILKDTDLATDYEKYLTSVKSLPVQGGETATNSVAFHIPTLEEYVEVIAECVAMLPEDMVVHRLTGDPPKKLLIEPKWAADKKKVLNAINERLNPSGPYYVYMLRCGDGTLYTGSTNNVEARVGKHMAGKGCKYTKSHQPVELVYQEEWGTKHEAMSREYAIKQLSKGEKEKLIRNNER